ncbi:MAG: hypothetical protein K2P81_05040 [Bacteriovoracaceae bacterium]|nr:hypothetical protein [Bacteriovoracaceae bacterium]
MKSISSNKPILIGLTALLAIGVVAYFGVIVQSKVLSFSTGQIAGKGGRVKYSLSFSPLALKLSQAIQLPALTQDTRFETIKLLSSPLNLRLTHFIKIGPSVSYLELTAKENPELNQDLKFEMTTHEDQSVTLTSDELKLSLKDTTLELKGLRAKIQPQKTFEVAISELAIESPLSKIKLKDSNSTYTESTDRFNLKASEAEVDEAKLSDLELEIDRKESVLLAGLYRGQEFDLDLKFEKFSHDGITLPLVSGSAQIPVTLADSLLGKKIEALMTKMREQTSSASDSTALKRFELTKDLFRKKYLYTFMDNLLAGVKFKRTPKAFIINLPREQALIPVKNDILRVKHFGDLLERLKKLPLADGLNEGLYLLVVSSYEQQVVRIVASYLEQMRKESKDLMTFKLLEMHLKLFNSQTGNVSNDLSSPIWEESALLEAKELYKQAQVEAPLEKLTIWMGARLAHNRDDKANLVLLYDQLTEMESDPTRKMFWKFHKFFWVDSAQAQQIAPELLKLNLSREMLSYVNIQYGYMLDRKTQYQLIKEIFKRVYEDRILPASQRNRLISFLKNNEQFSEAQSYIDKCYEEESDLTACEKLQLDVTYLTANQLRMSGRLDEAKKLFEDCLLLDPIDADVQVSLGHIAKSKGSEEAPRFWAMGCALGRSDMCNFQSVKDVLAR